MSIDDVGHASLMRDANKDVAAIVRAIVGPEAQVESAVLEYEDGKVFLLEVKASSTYRGEHTRGIRTLADRLGDRFVGGAVLGLSQESRWLGDGIWGLPVSTLWQHP